MHSWTTILRRTTLGLAALGLVGVASAADENNFGDSNKNTAACCQLTTSLVNDVLRGKDVSGDERFFSADGAPPNIHFLVDASGSMRELPQVINSEHSVFFSLTTNGCNNPRLDAFQASRGWNKDTVYPHPDLGTGLGSDNGFPLLFQDDKFYAYMYWNDSSEPDVQWTSKEQACQAQVPNWNTTNTAVYDRCIECLGTKGFWKLPGATARDTAPLTNLDFIFWGRFLNFNPPKYVTAKAVLKSVIKDLKRVRTGISHFAPNSNPVLTELLQPQNPSCSQILNDSTAFDNNRASYINSVNSLGFSTGTPLAKSLLNVGYYFSSDDSIYRTKFGFATNYNYPSEFRNGPLNSQGRSVCWGCQTSSVIIITDGEPSADSFSTQMAARMRTVNGGAVYCPDSLPCQSGTALSTRDKGTNPTNVTDDNPNYYLDDVAKMLYEQDLQANTPPQVGDFNTSGKQSIITYTVGFGINSNLLKNTAEVGGGLYYTAEDAPSLKQALLDIINNVQTRATSFSSPAASTLQVRSASATIIPRFKPARSKTEPWQGFLYRFKEGPERLLGCDPKNPTAGGDLNQDGDCNDTLMLDAAGDPIIENDEGNFVKLNSPLTPAVPFWEASAKLNAAPHNKWTTRRIYTIIDENQDGKLDFRDEPIEFTATNAAKLRDYLGIPNNPNACADLATKLGIPIASLPPEECAKLIINWYRGADALNIDPTKRATDREHLLGDIFHSGPANVDPPMPKNFCTFSTQCLSALFSGSTSQQNDYATTDRSDVLAYDKYVDAVGDRDKILLVGANDGMLHAFHNGKKVTTSDDVDPFTGQRKYDDGTGEELWAFIPPDLLPKLRPNVGKHAYFVDGTAMVRDVWIDGAGTGAKDNKKQWDEYRTVAVVGTGRGGVHRFALDLTRLLGDEPGESVGSVPDTGDFLWMWPQPCDPLALQVGESFTNFAPRPPPIGPVALTDAADQALRGFAGDTNNPGAGTWLIDNTPARERWVVALNGGFDEHMLRGRGVALVDIQSGHTVWSFFHGDGKPRSENMRYPVGAGVSMMDIGRADNPSVDADYLWDSATVGDYGGQVWMMRMWKPGTWNPTTQQVDNWFAARAFRVANLAGKTADEEAMRAPFSYMTLNTLQPDTGFLRTFVGTGDRENLLEKGTACRLSNPRGCAVQGCAVNNSISVTRGTDLTFTASSAYQNYHYTAGSAATGPEGKSCGGAQVTLSWNNDAQNGCGNGNDGSIQYTCDGDNTTWSCRETQNTWAQLNFLETTPAYPQRYYGLYTYGGTDPTRKFDSDAEAIVYDTNMYTDTDLVNVGQFDSTGQVITTSQQSAAPAGKGWYIQYGLDNERTGTSGTLQAGCVLWNSFEPSGASGAVCSTTGTNVSRLYQSNFATGLANCALGFYDKNQDRWARYTQSNTVAAPAEPAMQVSIGGGEISLGISMQGPGQSAKVEIQRSDEGVKSLYQLELDPRGHNCRHLGDTGACDQL